MEGQSPLGAADKEILNRITLRGAKTMRHIDKQSLEVETNVAALTAELEALEVAAAEEPSDGGESDTFVSPRVDSARGRRGPSSRTDSAASATERTQLQALVNELVADNDV